MGKDHMDIFTMISSFAEGSFKYLNTFGELWKSPYETKYPRTLSNLSWAACEQVIRQELDGMHKNPCQW